MSSRPSQIIKGLYLSGRPKSLLEWNSKCATSDIIHHVASIGGGKPQIDNGSFHIGVSDKGESEIVCHFDAFADFVNDKLNRQRNVLVHCMGGLRRSPCFVAAFLIKYKGYSAEDSIQYVKTKRPAIRPSEHQVSQLKIYEAALHKKNSLQLPDLAMASVCDEWPGCYHLGNYVYVLQRAGEIKDVWENCEDIVVPLFSLTQVFFKGICSNALKFKLPHGKFLLQGTSLNHELLTEIVKSGDKKGIRNIQNVFTALAEYAVDRVTVVWNIRNRTCTVLPSLGQPTNGEWKATLQSLSYILSTENLQVN